jgi:hypothetical protein
MPWQRSQQIQRVIAKCTAMWRNWLAVVTLFACCHAPVCLLLLLLLQLRHPGHLLPPHC